MQRDSSTKIIKVDDTIGDEGGSLILVLPKLWVRSRAYLTRVGIDEKGFAYVRESARSKKFDTRFDFRKREIVTSIAKIKDVKNVIIKESVGAQKINESKRIYVIKDKNRCAIEQITKAHNEITKSYVIKEKDKENTNIMEMTNEKIREEINELMRPDFGQTGVSEGHPSKNQ